MSDPQKAVHWIRRAQWGAMPENRAHLSKRVDPLGGVTVHHSTGATLREPDAADEAWVRAIQRDHMLSRGYGDIAYDALVGANGGIYEGRSHYWVGAHALSDRNVANRTTLGICVLGNGDTITPEQVAGIRAFLYVTFVGMNVRPCHVFGHRDWRAQGGITTYCPSNRVEALVSGFDHVFGHR